MGSIWRRAVR